MVRLYLILALTVAYCSLSAQQWVEEQYDFVLTSDIPYGTATDFNGEMDSLFLDLYQPQIDPAAPWVGRLPLIILVHGGGFRGGDKADPQFVPICESFARRGYVTASIGYRLGYINDSQEHACTGVAEFACLFGADEAEIPRAYHRGVQDVNRAIRFLTDCHEDYGINRNNVFVAGESAGGFIALGVGLTDVDGERLSFSLDQPPVAAPHPSGIMNCPHNAGRVFAAAIERPDLGPVHEEVDPSTLDYRIRGIGNMFGAIYGNLLAERDTGKLQPAIYSFHKRCDLIVPVDSGKVYAGFSWCVGECTGCTQIFNTDPVVYGSRGIADLNADNNYGYQIQAEFAGPEDPKTCFPFIPGGCIDQLSNDCHSYDSRDLRLNNMATLFASLIDSVEILCTPSQLTRIPDLQEVGVYPNPFREKLHVRAGHSGNLRALSLHDLHGRVVLRADPESGNDIQLSTKTIASGVYFLRLATQDGIVLTRRVVKH